MYALPDDFDFLLLSECYLEMVSFGVAITKLDFARPQAAPGVPSYKVSFCIEGGLTYKVGGILGRREFSDSYTSAPLLDFLLQDVVSVREIKGLGLEIIFHSGDTIVAEGDGESGYEAYSICLDSGDVVVA
ncbi:hypothetical protein [Pseudomonas citri]|uniref:hypothetical protein n=1 Tax=Pseudomonas citri TaxID=2978349 RepID=UPI0021B571D0|nr:hypothetical protein [Pseudomonas citri]